MSLHSSCSKEKNTIAQAWTLYHHSGFGSLSLTLALCYNFTTKVTKPDEVMRTRRAFWATSSHGLGKWSGWWIQKPLYHCSPSRGLTAMLAKVTSADVSLNCCRQSTRYYGTLREGRINKLAEGEGDQDFK